MAVYEDVGQHPTGAPRGTPATASTITAGGAGLFEGLSLGSNYYAVALVESIWRWVRIRTEEVADYADRVIHVDDYVDSNVSEDATADIMGRAYRDLVEMGGGDLQFGPRLYNCNLISDEETPFALSIYHDNVFFRGVPGTQIRTDANGSCLLIAGAGKVNGPDNYSDHRIWDTSLTPIYAINPASQHARTITLASSSDASHFSVGSNVYIRTGQRIPNAQNRNSEPDAEFNKVLAINGAVLTLERPLAKPYVQEYQSAVGAKSVRTNPGGYIAAPFGVANITDRTLTNVGYSGIKFTNTQDRSAVIVRGAVDWLEVANVEYDTYRHGADTIEWRGKVDGVKAVMRGTGNVGALWPHTFATACTDCSILNVDAQATQAIAQLHMHEGSARCYADYIRLKCASGIVSTSPTVSITNRAYNNKIGDHVEIINWGDQAAGLLVGEGCDGGVDVGAITVRDELGDTGRSAIAVRARNVTVSPRAQVDGRILFATQGLTETAAADYPTIRSAQMDYISGELTKLRRNEFIGYLPEDSIVDKVTLLVVEGFNWTTNNLVRVGDGVTPSLFLGDRNVTTSGTRVDAEPATNLITTRTAVYADHRSDGSANAVPTGKMYVIVYYTRVAQLAS